ncbi:probable protein phosphatase 2C 2 [Mercurialis annua]|uniref:probable protein phosphatase 2C 2 n=1 Tax=Mercurialis annua TaxID=3986 RepID=UPI00215EA2A0|nr:probable protein phosphatase 2C 2 [Mercurialis annua]
MIHFEDFLRRFSVISLQTLTNLIISMASLCLTSPTTSSSSSSSSLPSPLSWVSHLFLEPPQPQQQQAEDIYSSKNNIIFKDVISEKKRKGNLHDDEHFEAYQKSLHDKCGSSVGENNIKGMKLKRRPAKLVVPEYCPRLEFGDKDKKLEKKEFEVQGKDFCLASKKGRREVMEDGYGVMLDILGDPKQAFFAVIDGHGGRAAADFVAENLGKNIVKGLETAGEQPEKAIRSGYMVTDKEFLSQEVSSGACAASVVLRNGELHVANVGDCRVVMSRKGVADTLTIDHRVSREDERIRIENSGGFVQCRNGMWRVQGSLAISRAIGDLHLKEWIISEPEIKTIPLTSDSQFLIMASDGLWDKVNEQEAVDIVLRGKNSVEACKKLIEISFNRGNLDDITVMLINLQNFIVN